MRTTITLDDDVAAAIEQLRRERAVGVSEVVNDLVRSGLRARPDKRRFRQQTHKLGLTVDVTNVADALEQLDGPSSR